VSLIILVADGTMAAVLRAFFEREFHHALGCAAFDFDPASDIFKNPLEKDGGVHRRCHEILRPYLNTHRRALVVLDQQFGAERPEEEVRGEIERRLNTNGWDGRATAIVIDPELEVPRRGLRLVHRRLRHPRSQRGKGAACRTRRCLIDVAVWLRGLGLETLNA
jgi:hypothetical protein